MSIADLARRSPGTRRSRAGALEAAPTARLGPVPERVLRWQQQAGNRAVAELLVRRDQTTGPTTLRTGPHTVQRKDASHRENAPIASPPPSGSMDEAQWSAAYQAARAHPSAAAYAPLFRDVALTAGMDALGAGFVPGTVPESDGKTAQPGLNLTLDVSGEPGHTGLVAKDGTFGVPTPRGSSGPLDVSIAIILTPQALAAEKELSLRAARHEMVHAWHKVKVLAALRTWRALPPRGRPEFARWLRDQGARRTNPTSALDVALIGAGAQDAAAGTEVLAYVEGFLTDFHRRPATMDKAGPAFFELLGAVETRRLYTWAQAGPVVRAEALTRLREYHATLDAAHQQLWKAWLDAQLPKAAKDATGRKDFLTALTAFVV